MIRRSVPAGAFLSLALAAGLAQAGPYCGCYYPPIPQAPDMCNPGYYWTSGCGMTYGPSHCVYPPYPPFQGMVPCPTPRGGAPGMPGMPGAARAPGLAGPGAMPSPTFPTHPYARSPRDFFMYYDKDEPSYAPTSSYGAVGASAYSATPYYATPPAPAAPLPVTPPPIPEERPR